MALQKQMNWYTLVVPMHSHSVAHFIVSEKDAKIRLDQFVANMLPMSREQAQKMIERGAIAVEGKTITKVATRLNIKDEISVHGGETDTHIDDTILISKESSALRPTLIQETGDYLIIEKPSGLLIHPTGAKEKETVASWIMQQFPEIASVGESPIRPGIIHRLDKEASGLVVIARTGEMFDHLKKQFQDRIVEKEYFVLAHGVIESDHGMIDFPIDRGSDGRMVARPRIKEISLKTIRSMQDGKDARTEFWVEKRYANYTLLRVRIHTGRMHQIRVHFFAMNHPVVGDTLYRQRKKESKKTGRLERLFLHAGRLCFDELSGKRVCFESKLPRELSEFLKSVSF